MYYIGTSFAHLVNGNVVSCKTIHGQYFLKITVSYIVFQFDVNGRGSPKNRL